MGLVAGLLTGLLGMAIEVHAGGNSLLGQQNEDQEPDEEELGSHALFEF
mgnify:FL=1